ncbi:hypothetical protein BpHYR1_014119 [Brachionus plicatilis]|uniref:Uncharacterized protein n=1 Tax=Brachionus plicatilis TaxID=10195 RepID=A0A3M7Q1R6_BRAPC|nr:hypothetical protein BpHYR1_014119 [Brachionus plicatilis]
MRKIFTKVFVKLILTMTKTYVI